MHVLQSYQTAYVLCLFDAWETICSDCTESSGIMCTTAKAACSILLVSMWLAESSANADSVTTILNLLPERIKDLVLQHLNGRQPGSRPDESMVDVHTSRSIIFVSFQELHLTLLLMYVSAESLLNGQDSMSYAGYLFVTILEWALARLVYH